MRGEYQSGYVHTGSGAPISVYRSARGVRKAGAFNWCFSVDHFREFISFFHRPNIQNVN
jgi:hypothetical protein